MYRPPVDEMAHTLKKIAGLEDAIAQGRFGDLSDDLIDAILEEAGKFASTRVAPLLQVGDRHGTPLKDAEVTMPPGWKDVYRDWIAGGWNGLTGEEEYGGQGLPMMLAIATFEMWNSGSMAFGIGPTLTLGAIEALEAHATHELKQIYLPKLISGKWMGTMNLTEPQAGSDVGALRTRAERSDDGTYRVFGTKIFITYGEHDLTENIIHMVLARLPDAPAGTKGISLFLVPKFLVNEDGSLGARNDVFCGGIEHKMGIHGSPTCTMIYGDGFANDREAGAVGWLIGEENRGLACMFTMMNNARLAVGIQGVAVAEAAYQKSLAYAQERRQMRAPGWVGEGMSPIIEHQDVQRDLLTMKGLTGAARSIAYACAHALDMAKKGTGDDARWWADRANLLTPVAKAFCTDVGVDVASIGIQIHGGMGYIEETGAAQFLRDARIAPIYEGTNGIQAIDLVQRKLQLGGGEHVKDYIAELRNVADAVGALNTTDLRQTATRLQTGLNDLEQASLWLQRAITAGQIREAYAGATPYLRLFGLAAGATYLAKGALAGRNPGRTALARFFAENLLSETSTLKDRIIHGAPSLLDARMALGS
ncbi:acyl-CoA dehydrogenase family protein [Phyllobacterium endophyticum]|uniref:acyl-CoA dehydrogenase family protein n=1 Tax=Phyllobacterium endophyticum TaxID=1149773 RepID=UPI0011C787F5|nr:acyl-CoA dehydrogenase family protein [Phyllobacterium endophyticum]TXR48124.1 acyl-CoA dehydrogenase [Phyllobacterium endophyticum]